MPVENANAAAMDGTLAKGLQSIIEDLKPEATYFLAENGRRTGYFFLDMKDPSQIPECCEPFFLAMNARIELTPVMSFEDLQKAGPAIENAVMKYGNNR
jgi:hypothetical protein